MSELEFTGNLFSSFVETWSRAPDAKDHTKQIQRFTQNNEFMVLMPGPAYEHPNISFSYEDSTISLPLTHISD